MKLEFSEPIFGPTIILALVVMGICFMALMAFLIAHLASGGII